MSYFTNCKFNFASMDINDRFYFPVNKGSFVDPKIEYHKFTKNTAFSAIDSTDDKVYNFNLADEVFLNDLSWQRFID